VCAQGGWAFDLKQGLGKKVYANGDVYEGLWRAGKCEGPGRYRWKNKNEYDGEWRAGRMHGRGTLKWNTGGALLLGPCCCAALQRGCCGIVAGPAYVTCWASFAFKCGMSACALHLHSHLASAM
jgi:hypothetical protein